MNAENDISKASAAVTRKGRMQRVVSCRKTAPAVVRSIMFLLGVEYVADENFTKAVNLVREKWHDGYKDGLRRSIAKLKAIYAEREGS